MLCGLFLVMACTFSGCSSKEDQPVVADGNTTAVPSKSLDAEKTPDANAVKAAADVNAAVRATEIKNIPTGKKQIVPAEPVSVAAVMLELGTNIGGERKIELLESLSDRAFDEDPNVIEAIQETISDPNVQVAEAAMALLQDYDSSVALPAISAAMQNPDASIRQSAVEFLVNIEDPQTAEILTQAFGDAAEDVRSAAIDAAMQQNEDVQYALAKTSLDSPHKEIKDASVSMLESMGNKKAVDSLINGLRDKDLDFRQSVIDTLESLTEQKFTTFEQAQKWWGQNQDKYDNELVLQETDEN